MTLEMKIREEREEAFEEGIEKGIEKGIERGRSAIIEVLKALSNGKSEEYLRDNGFDEETIVSAKQFLEESGKII